MINCSQCNNPINPAKDNYATLSIKAARRTTYEYLHLENCTQEWLIENTVGGIIE